MKREYSSGGDAYFVPYGPVVKYCRVDAFVKLYPESEAALRAGCFGPGGKVVYNRLYVVLIVVLQGPSQLPQVLFVFAASYEIALPPVRWLWRR
ncbi:hypothetical protein ACQ86N_20130 [Puia sp. P3]|uniref:hypothetical protein n=1 Tax=Puia sp. P3 TaxID=3423952 RepID=UPI003D679886